MNIFDKCYDYADADFAKKAGLYGFYRKGQGFNGSAVLYEGKKIIMTASNNYLGLAHDPRVIEAAVDATRKYGTSCTGSRLLNGNLDLHEELEQELASFLGKESAVVLSTGFLANQAAMESIAGKGDTLLSDAENHASIISGCSLSKAALIRYQHNDMDDLSSKIDSLATTDRPLIISDGVFSMGGDIVDLPAMLNAARRADGRKIPIVIDDAHGLGVIGKGGRGTASHYGLDKDVDLIVGTFSKSLASVGGFIAGDAENINFIRHKARSLIFTAGLPAGPTAAALQALRIVQSEPERIDRLRSNAAKVKKAFQDIGLNVLHSETPIIPILVGEEGLACKLTQELFAKGIFATPVIYPAVAYGQAIIRTSFMCSHSQEQIDQVIDAFRSLAKRYALDQVGPSFDSHGPRLARAPEPEAKNYRWAKGVDRKSLVIAGTKALLKRKILKFASTL